MLAAGLSWAPLVAQARPSPAVPDGLGVNIHFTAPLPGEVEMLAGTGFHWVRMDLFWNRVERQRGQYDFARYDSLVANLDRHGLRALFILDYGNRLYDRGAAPASDSARAAFARFAAAAVRRYAGRGYLWEIWNEPNLKYWRPRPDAAGYARLANEVLDSLDRARPNERVVGPGVAGFDWGFLDACAKAGLLARWWGVSVHPYRRRAPETVLHDITQLRSRIRRAVASGRQPEVIVSEWGYSAVRGRSEMDQARLWSREMLSLLAAEVPVAIWYDWRNDGQNPADGEQNFGLVRQAFRPGDSLPFEPKPAWYAARGLTEVLGGFSFSARIPTPDPEVYVLRFRRGSAERLAAWASDGRVRQVELSLPARGLRHLDIRGDYKRTLRPHRGRYQLLVDGEPIFLVPSAVAAP